MQNCNHSVRTSRPALAVAGLLLAASLGLSAQEAPAQPEKEAARAAALEKVNSAGPWRSVLVSKSQRTPYSQPVVPGSWAHVTPARVLLSAAETATELDKPGDVRLLRKGELENAGATLEEITKVSMAYLQDLLLRQPVEYFRDKAGVVEYAAMTGPDPSISALALLPEFYKRFEPVFGADFVIVIPNQQTIFMFPQKGGTLNQFARPLADQYRESATPVSLEIFLVSEKGLAVIGELPR